MEVNHLADPEVELRSRIKSDLDSVQAPPPSPFFLITGNGLFLFFILPGEGRGGGGRTPKMCFGVIFFRHSEEKF